MSDGCFRNDQFAPSIVSDAITAIVKDPKQMNKAQIQQFKLLVYLKAAKFILIILSIKYYTQFCVAGILETVTLTIV